MLILPKVAFVKEALLGVLLLPRLKGVILGEHENNEGGHADLLLEDASVSSVVFG